jgi:hypothetical protein
MQLPYFRYKKNIIFFNRQSSKAILFPSFSDGNRPIIGHSLPKINKKLTFFISPLKQKISACPERPVASKHREDGKQESGFEF